MAGPGSGSITLWIWMVQRGEPVNDVAVRAIAAALEIPVQLGGGVRSRAEPCWTAAWIGSFSERWRLNSQI